MTPEQRASNVRGLLQAIADEYPAALKAGRLQEWSDMAHSIITVVGTPPSPQCDELPRPVE